MSFLSRNLGSLLYEVTSVPRTYEKQLLKGLSLQ